MSCPLRLSVTTFDSTGAAFGFGFLTALGFGLAATFFFATTSLQVWDKKKGANVVSHAAPFTSSDGKGV